MAARLLDPVSEACPDESTVQKGLLSLAHLKSHLIKALPKDSEEMACLDRIVKTIIEPIERDLEGPLFHRGWGGFEANWEAALKGETGEVSTRLPLWKRWFGR